MSHARFFMTEELPTERPFMLPLSAADAKHASRVLRVAQGEQIDVVAPSGAGWRVRVLEVTREGVIGATAEPLQSAWRPHVALFQGVAKGEKMDAIVRQAVEVGVGEVVPVVTSRTVVRLDERKRAERGERWRRVAASAAKQARREAVPCVCDPEGFEEALRRLGEYDAVIVLWEDSDGRLLSPTVRPLFADKSSRIALFVGPEGGLGAEEVARLTESGAITATLGPSILRTETAAVVAVATVVASGYEMDALRNE